MIEKNDGLGAPAITPSGASGGRFAPVAEDGDQALQPPSAPPHDAAMRIMCGLDDLVKWQMEPFYAVQWNAATDAHVLVGYKGEPHYPAIEKSNVAERVDQFLTAQWPKWVVASGTLKTADVIEALENWPRVMETDCPDCAGCGQLDRYDDRGEALDCERCKGECVIVAKPGEAGFYDPLACVYVEGIAYFKHFTWHKLGPFLKAIGADELNITHGSHNTMLRLEATGTPFVIGVMPVMRQDEETTLDHKPFRVLRVTDRSSRDEGAGPKDGTHAEPDGEERAGTPKTSRP